LFEAACQEVAERGIAAASLDAIARRAGLTKGAVYSTYGSRAELLLAVVDALPQPDIRISAESVDDIDWDELGAQLGRTADEAPHQVFLLLELMSQAGRDNDMHLRMTKRLTASAERVAEVLAPLLQIDSAAALQLATDLHAQLVGLWAMRALLGPDRVPDETFRDAMRAFLSRTAIPS
jgi:AcrR family transcriptional regulator